MPSSNTHSSHSSQEKENPSISHRKAQHKAHSSSRRNPLTNQNRSDPSDVQPDGDTNARIRELEAQIHQLRDVHPPPREREIPSIARPKRVSDVTMAEICDALGFEKDKWIDLRSCTRDCLSAARLDTKLNWKAQDPTKLGMAYNAIEQDFPELRRFEGKWGVERIAKDTWDNRKSYKSCSRKPSTYVGRRAAARREARRQRSRLSSPLASPPRSPARSPGPPSPRSPSTPGPSQPPRARRQPRRIPSSEDDSGDDLLNLYAPEQQQQEEEEEEGEDPSGKGKKRAKSGGGSSGKRRKN
ncbi:hypothetical protein C8R43DRAFT_948299 [Mycena crocata]|nr:hypothetical protein C8R43DRAFT_948299 [Mycena crocata]